MKYSLSLGLIATAFFTVVAGDACELESDLQTRVETVTTTTTTENGTAAVFQPVAVVGLNKTSVARVVPSVDLPLLPYGSNTSDIVIGVNHTMKYPSVLLEGIASVSSVDCSETSVAITFNDSSIFAATQVEWSNGTLILVTNHMGDCDAEAERGFFLVDSLVWNTTSLVATATSSKTDVNSTAAFTEIFFGQPTSNSNLTARDIVLDPSFTISNAIDLPSTVLYSYAPYVKVTADSASFAANVTLSGYLAYNWLTFHVDSLYFDFDLSLSSHLTLSADITSSYNGTFTYAPSSLYYGLSVPGIVELGPELQFSVSAEVAASEAVTLTTGVGIELTDGNVHLDLLAQDGTTTSGWVPTYSASANISGQAVATLNPVAAVTVDLSIVFFGGILDLSSGVTAKPGFENDFILTAAEGVDLSGVTNVTSGGVCAEGLAISSNFTFAVEVFVTEWWSDEVYNVVVPILDECFSWE